MVQVGKATKRSFMALKKNFFFVFLVASLFTFSSCATTGPKVTQAELDQIQEEFNAKFFEASQVWLPRVYRVGYKLLTSHITESADEKPKHNFAGIGVTELKDYARKCYGIDKKVRGVLVLGTYPGSQAEGLDFQSGDVIQMIDGKKVSGLGDYFGKIKRINGTNTRYVRTKTLPGAGTTPSL